MHALVVSIASLVATLPAAPSAEILQAQALRCERLLKSSVVDFYLPACVDRENGGYLEVWRGGKFVPSGEKFLVMQARELWFFSTLAREGIEKEKSLAAAKVGFEFLEAKMLDRKHGGYFAKVTDSGEPKDRRKHVYLNAFSLYALVAYHKASHDPAALDAAKALYQTLDLRAYDRKNGGYLEFFTEDWQAIEDQATPGFVGAIGTKTYNTHLHVLEALAELYRVWPDPSVRRRLEEMVLINVQTVRHPEVFCNIDGWRPDWRMIQAPSNLKASYGHDIECTWLVLDASRALEQPEATLREWAISLCGNSLKYGFDRQHGGFYNTGPPGQPADDTKKEWWVQAEALPSMLSLYRLTGDPAYYEAFARTLDFVEAHQVAPGGGWFATRNADGTSKDDARSSPWQGAYHSGRALILSARWLNELAQGN